MANEVITSLEQVNAGWLTAVLTRRSGALTHGSVATVDINSGGGNWSTNALLTVGYSEEAAGELPQRLFLKMVATDASSSDEFFGASEVTYYTRDYLDFRGAPLIRCYDAAYSEEEQRYHLLLDDVSDTHIEAAEKEPTLEYGLALAEGLAVMQALFARHPKALVKRTQNDNGFTLIHGDAGITTYWFRAKANGRFILSTGSLSTGA